MKTTYFPKRAQQIKLAAEESWNVADLKVFFVSGEFFAWLFHPENALHEPELDHQELRQPPLKSEYNRVLQNWRLNQYQFLKRFGENQ